MKLTVENIIIVVAMAYLFHIYPTLGFIAMSLLLGFIFLSLPIAFLYGVIEDAANGIKGLFK